MQIRRGDIVVVNPDPNQGSELRGTRPCVVVQNDTGNQNSPTMIIAPCTTPYTAGQTYPFEFELLAADSALIDDSVVDCSQLRVVDVSARILKNIGSIPSTRFAALDRALQISLGL